ncbi:MAG: hypothetical protein GWM88_17245 [Pseudomonadales bacterium]|nr:hypothetical protein [Pseudomonadales bacterium]NIX09679.1 hypothetical protein [Pseudomonadales bacterium]
MVALLLMAGLGVSPHHAEPVDAFGYGLRVTARTAFLFFMLAYLARPVRELTGGSTWLVRHRRYLGLAMAVAHTVHFGYIVLYFRAVGELPDAITIVFGGGAFVVMWLMALTSNDASVRRLGARWRRLHRGGMHYLWFIFAYTWLGVALVDPWYWGFVAVALIGFAVRIAAQVARRRSATAQT